MKTLTKITFPMLTLAMLATPQVSISATSQPSVGNIVPMSAYSAQFQTLKAKVRREGNVRVLVRMRAPMPTAEKLSVQAQRSQQASIAQAQKRILKDTVLPHPKSVKRFKHIPYLAMQVDASALEQLKASPDVLGVTEDLMMHAVLSDSVPLTGGTNAWAKGYSGAGQTVAILDTGVDKQHPQLAGKVVDEACYSTSEFDNFLESACPSGAEEQVGTGAGVNCSADACLHGTHVAAIAAGKSGVAKDANIIAVQVFTLSRANEFCNYLTPCTTAFYSDIAKGMEYVYNQRNRFKIASVNLSLGDNFPYSGACDGDPEIEPIRQVAEQLRSAGIATVFASGNSSVKNGLTRPACLSNVISVGATTKGDFVADFSNSGTRLNLLAPGVSIVSAIPGGGYESLNGTSMAAPHVAGAWAVLKSKQPAASIDTVLSALSSTGAPVTDYFNMIVKPRIQIDAALDALAGSTPGPTPPGPPPPLAPLTLVAPSGNINTGTPTYRWTALPNTFWYLVWLYDQNGNFVTVGYASPSDAGCADVSKTCTLKSTKTLLAGKKYNWQVSAVVGFKVRQSAKVNFTIAK